jgi:hypothetical protein
MSSLVEKIKNNITYIISSIVAFIILGAVYREFFSVKIPAFIPSGILFTEGLNPTEESADIAFSFGVSKANFSFAEYRHKSCKNSYSLVLVVDMSDSMTAGKLPSINFF